MYIFLKNQQHEILNRYSDVVSFNPSAITIKDNGITQIITCDIDAGEYFTNTETDEVSLSDKIEQLEQLNQQYAERLQQLEALLAQKGDD